MLSRRSLLRGGLMCFVLAGILQIARRRGIPSEPKLIRPPGAIPEPFFSANCTRCGACVSVCPTKLLQLVSSPKLSSDYLTPIAVFDPAFCMESCTACTKACPSGALQKLTRDEKKDAKLGTAVVTFEYCRLYDDIECRICARECPTEAISFTWSEAEYRQIVVVDKERCTGCGLCVVTCPIGHEPDVSGQKQSPTERPLRIV